MSERLELKCACRLKDCAMVLRTDPVQDWIVLRIVLRIDGHSVNNNSIALDSDAEARLLAWLKARQETRDAARRREQHE